MRGLLQKLAWFLWGNEVLPILLNPLRRKTQQVSTDGVYDTRACHHVLKNKGTTPSIPLRSNAGYLGGRAS
ncbi:Mobile element protein [Candidatus Enterovibrio escicola]|uniref:Mobile element protein n=1 Tax=Candidatus Enterovibrio escicola TaxID=1927127 RepID=A0A2A5T281_9GAMM|nr:Mobile element protein [Candidatus Enterovibrio escacola]